VSVLIFPFLNRDGGGGQARTFVRGEQRWSQAPVSRTRCVVIDRWCRSPEWRSPRPRSSALWWRAPVPFVTLFVIATTHRSAIGQQCDGWYVFWLSAFRVQCPGRCPGCGPCPQRRPSGPRPPNRQTRASVARPARSVGAAGKGLTAPGERRRPICRPGRTGAQGG